MGILNVKSCCDCTSDEVELSSIRNTPSQSTGSPARQIARTPSQGVEMSTKNPHSGRARTEMQTPATAVKESKEQVRVDALQQDASRQADQNRESSRSSVDKGADDTKSQSSDAPKT